MCFIRALWWDIVVFSCLNLLLVKSRLTCFQTATFGESQQTNGGGGKRVMFPALFTWVICGGISTEPLGERLRWFDLLSLKKKKKKLFFISNPEILFPIQQFFYIPFWAYVNNFNWPVLVPVKAPQTHNYGTSALITLGFYITSNAATQ